MKRNVDIKEITDGKRYRAGDLCKLGCKNCLNCSDCCRDRGSMVLLDPYDLYQLTKAAGQDFDALLQAGHIQLGMVDGLALPGLGVKTIGTGEQCVFLQENGRCSIHAYRPGICRMFPLGRLYEDDGFTYILQTGECSQPDGMKIKISKWLGIPNLPQYEKYILEYHRILKSVQADLENREGDFRQKVNMSFLTLFFRKPYDPENDFYEQFEERKQYLN